MPVKLLPHLRLLNPCLPLTTKPSLAVKPSCQAIPIFSRIFRHKLKYQCVSGKDGIPLLATQQQPQQFRVRRFSTRSRPGSSGDVRASKSLMDDEAELSDWVSGLRSDSFRTRLYSSDDDVDGDGDNIDHGSGRGGGSNRRRVSGDRVSSAKMQRDSDSDDSGMLNRRMGRDSFGSGNSRGKARFGDKLQGEDEGFVSQRRGSGWRGGQDSSIAKRSGRSELGYGRDRGTGSGGGRGSEWGYSRDRASGSDGGRGSNSGYGRDRGVGNGGGRGSELGYARDRGAGGGGGGRGSNLGYGRDRGAGGGGRGSELGYGRNRGAGSGRGGGFKGGVKSLGKRGFVTSVEEIGDDDDEEGEKRLMKSFRDLISEEDSEEEDDDDSSDDMLKNGGSLFASNKEASPWAVPSSPGRSDSYLSETRCPDQVHFVEPHLN